MHNHDPTTERPKIFNWLAEQPRDNLNAKKFSNQLLVCVALKLKNPDGSPHEPSTVAARIRALFAELAKQGAPWQQKDFAKWDGAFVDVVNQAFEACLKKDNEFGKKHRKEFAQEDCDKIASFVRGLGPDGRIEHSLHILQFSLGTQFGLRGRNEHRDMRFDDFRFGHCSLSAGNNLAGRECVEINGAVLSKTNKLAIGMHLFLCSAFFHILTMLFCCRESMCSPQSRRQCSLHC